MVRFHLWNHLLRGFKLLVDDGAPKDLILTGELGGFYSQESDYRRLCHDVRSWGAASTGSFAMDGSMQNSELGRGSQVRVALYTTGVHTHCCTIIYNNAK